MFTQTLHAAGEIHRMAVRTVLEFSRAARVSHPGHSRVHTDAQEQWPADNMPPVGFQAWHLREHPERRTAGALGMALQRHGCVPHSQNTVSGIVDNQSIMFE